MNLRKNYIEASLVYLVRGEGKKQEVLLAKKLRKIGVGKLNGFGGSKNKNETMRACLKRELEDESGLTTKKEDPELVAKVTFYNQRGKSGKFIVKVLIFILKKWTGTLKLKKDEMAEPKWYKTCRLPLKRLMPDDPFWFPLILNGKKVVGQAWYSPNQKFMVKPPKIRVVKNLGDID